MNNSALFRATTEELCTCIPKDLKKILVLDEWHHREFYQFPEFLLDSLPVSKQMRAAYIANPATKEKTGLDIESYSNLFANQAENNKQHNQREWRENRPGAYETWQMLA